MAVFELEESDYVGPLEEDSVVEVEITSVNVKLAPFKDKETGADIHQVEFTFVIDEPDGEYAAWDTQKLYGRTGTKFNTHPNCRLRNWAQAILNTELPAGYALDTDVLVGHKARAVVSVNEWEDKKTGELRQNNPVKDLMPSRHAALPAEDTF